MIQIEKWKDIQQRVEDNLCKTVTINVYTMSAAFCCKNKIRQYYSRFFLLIIKKLIIYIKIYPNISFQCVSVSTRIQLKIRGASTLCLEWKLVTKSFDVKSNEKFI